MHALAVLHMMLWVISSRDSLGMSCLRALWAMLMNQLWAVSSSVLNSAAKLNNQHLQGGCQEQNANEDVVCVNTLHSWLALWLLIWLKSGQNTTALKSTMLL